MQQRLHSLIKNERKKLEEEEEGEGASAQCSASNAACDNPLRQGLLLLIRAWSDMDDGWAKTIVPDLKSRVESRRVESGPKRVLREEIRYEDMRQTWREER